MLALVIAICLTLGVSAVCSVLEAMILSTTQTDIELLKKKNVRKGESLELIRTDLEETISSILTLNTIANTLGAVMVGGIATNIFGEAALGVISGLMAFGILFFSEIIPKNIGVHYRRSLQPVSIVPLLIIRNTLRPITYLANKVIKLILRERDDEEGETESEILLLAERGAEEGELDKGELDLITNALSLDDVKVYDLMTPRTVVIGAKEGEKLSELLHRLRTIRFGRLPVYGQDDEEVIGVVRRRDILHCIAVGDGNKTVGELKQETVYFPETATASDTLESLLRGNQQIGMVVDEFGGFAGVITIEDIIEHLIGKEIYEKDDVAVDMREMARLKSKLVTIKERKPHPSADS